MPLVSLKSFAATQYGCWPKGTFVLTSMNWLFGSGDWVAGTRFHTTSLPVVPLQASWTSDLPAHWA